jgi:hypothetical protein
MLHITIALLVGYNSKGNTMTNEVILAVSDEGESEYYQVPIRKKDFGDFITNLLGQPETIEERRTGSYEINLEWIQNIHYLLDQRIKQQAQASLVDFSAEFKYREAPNRKITALDSFLNFNETKKVSTRGVRIIWTYLIKFPNKPSPEKQEVSLTLLSDRTKVIRLGNAEVKKEISNSNGLIAYKISHTERTWGDDIQNILDNEVDSIFIEKKWYSKYFERSIPILSLLFFTAGLVVPEYIKNQVIAADYLRLLANSGVDASNLTNLDINNKLTILLKLSDPSSSLHDNFSWYQGISFASGVFLAIFSLFAFDFEKPSYIKVTNEDKKIIAKCKSKDKWLAIKKGGGYILAIAAGVVGNYCYYLLNT